jgi:hypothetical protein
MPWPTEDPATRGRTSFLTSKKPPIIIQVGTKAVANHFHTLSYPFDILHYLVLFDTTNDSAMKSARRNGEDDTGYQQALE